jgi:3-oxoadipate enol-lactonase
MPTLALNGTEIYHEEAGEGTPLLFVHGLGSSAQDWEFQAAEFSKDYRVITLDLRGHGRSGKPPGPYTMEMFARDAVGLLHAVSVQSAHVVGVSLGGGVAFEMAVRFPSAVRSLVIVNSGPDAKIRSFRQRLLVWTRMLMARFLSFRKIGETVGKKLFPEPELAGVRAMFVERYARNDRQGYRASLRAFIGWSVASQIESIACPTLAIAADNDYTPVALKEAYVRRMPGAELVVIPDSRHALPMEKPQQFNAVLRAFLERHAERRPS